MLACANNYISPLIQLHYLFWLYYTPIKANIILGFMALFALHYQCVEIIVCWEIKLHYCVSFSCLINNDGWLLFSSPPATILSSPWMLKMKNKTEREGGCCFRSCKLVKTEVDFFFFSASQGPFKPECFFLAWKQANNKVMNLQSEIGSACHLPFIYLYDCVAGTATKN